MPGGLPPEPVTFVCQGPGPCRGPHPPSYGSAFQVSQAFNLIDFVEKSKKIEKEAMPGTARWVLAAPRGAWDIIAVCKAM